MRILLSCSNRFVYLLALVVTIVDARFKLCNSAKKNLPTIVRSVKLGAKSHSTVLNLRGASDDRFILYLN